MERTVFFLIFILHNLKRKKTTKTLLEIELNLKKYNEFN